MKYAATGLLFAIMTAPVHAEQLFDAPLVEADALQAFLGNDNLAIIDVRNKIDGGSKDAFIEGHIPGSVYSNYLEAGWRIEKDGVTGIVAEKAALEQLIGSLGVGNDDQVVIVHGGKNATDFGSATRIYWTFKYLGHDDVAILNGGYRDWQSDAGRPIEAGWREAEPAMFDADLRADLLISTDEVEQTLLDDGYVRVDARPYSQHVGQTKSDLVSAKGRIPDSIGLENALFIDSQTGRVKPLDELKALAPVTISGDGATIISYCNTGHWASVNWFVMSELLGYDNVRLFDASMAGWTKDPDHKLSLGERFLHELSRWTDQG